MLRAHASRAWQLKVQASKTATKIVASEHGHTYQTLRCLATSSHVGQQSSTQTPEKRPIRKVMAANRGWLNKRNAYVVKRFERRYWPSSLFIVMSLSFKLLMGERWYWNELQYYLKIVSKMDYWVKLKCSKSLPLLLISGHLWPFLPYFTHFSPFFHVSFIEVQYHAW